MSKKTKRSKKSEDNQETFEHFVAKEFFTLGHLIKYNIYLLSKAIVFNALLRKEDFDINKAVNYTEAVLHAFHEQDHPSVKSDKTEKKEE